MKILLLSEDEKLRLYLESTGNEVTKANGVVSAVFVKNGNYDWLISYGYRNKISSKVLSLFDPSRRINLHISYLPWNKGADPNLWSWIDKTPKGVSIHQLDSGIDTGPICHRRHIALVADEDTLRTSYEKLSKGMFELFKDTWPQACRRGGYGTITLRDNETGSSHLKSQRPKLDRGWDTPVLEFMIDRL